MFSVNRGCLLLQMPLQVLYWLLRVSVKKNDLSRMAAALEQVSRGTANEDNLLKPLCMIARQGLLYHVSRLNPDLIGAWELLMEHAPLSEVVLCTLARALNREGGAYRAAAICFSLRERNKLTRIEVVCTTILHLCSGGQEERRRLATIIRSTLDQHKLEPKGVFSTYIATACEDGKPELALEMALYAGTIPVPVDDLIVVLERVISAGHLKCASQALALLKECKVEGLLQERLDRLRAQLLSLQEEESLRSKLAAQPHTLMPRHKKALFKSSLLPADRA